MLWLKENLRRKAMRKLLNIINSLLTEFPSTHYKKDTEVIISKINSIKEKEKRK